MRCLEIFGLLNFPVFLSFWSFDGQKFFKKNRSFEVWNFRKTKTETTESPKNSGLKVVSFGIPIKSPKILVNFDIFYLKKKLVSNWVLIPNFWTFLKQSEFSDLHFCERFAKFNRTSKLLAERIALPQTPIQKQDRVQKIGLPKFEKNITWHLNCFPMWYFLIPTPPAPAHEKVSQINWTTFQLFQERWGG